MPYMGLIVLIVMIAALVDIIGSESGVRGLPRWGWLLLVVVLPLVGSVVWFFAGRPVNSGHQWAKGSGRATAMGYPEYDVPGRFEPANPEADAEFLRKCRERADQQRQQAELDRRRRDQAGGS